MDEGENVNDPIIIEDDDAVDEVGGAVDMDAYLEEEDPNCYMVKKPAKTNQVVNDEDLVKTRTYNLHITYDKYYQVKFYFVNFNKF